MLPPPREIVFKIKKKTGGTYGAKKETLFAIKHLTPLELKIVSESLAPAESRVYSKANLKARLRRCLLFKSDSCPPKPVGGK
jgi:hypothetical protein